VTQQVCEPVPKLLLSVKHIGPRRARRLIDGLGEDWLEIIDADPERAFATLRGMGSRRAQVAARSWRGTRRLARGGVPLSPVTTTRSAVAGAPR
jgi:hypothetical protein